MARDNVLAGLYGERDELRGRLEALESGRFDIGNQPGLVSRENTRDVIERVRQQLADREDMIIKFQEDGVQDS
jgi:hypothetical protein